MRPGRRRGIHREIAPRLYTNDSGTALQAGVEMALGLEGRGFTEKTLMAVGEVGEAEAGTASQRSRSSRRFRTPRQR